MRGAIAASTLLALLGCEQAARRQGTSTTGSAGRPEPPARLLTTLEPPERHHSPTRRRSALSARARKRHAAEVCFYGSMGIGYAADAYWTSLGAEAPSALVVPRFGAYEEHRPRRQGGPLPLAAKMGRLPFEPHVRACATAKRLAHGTWPALDAALEAFSGYTTPVLQALSAASRYYARGTYRRDSMRRGLALHEQLSDELRRFEPLHRAYGQTLQRWLAAHPDVQDDAKRDDTATLVASAVAAARPLAWAGTHGQSIETTRVATLRKARGALATHAARTHAPHAQVAVRRLDLLVEQLGHAPAGGAALDTVRYRIAQRYAALLDADQQALSIALGGAHQSADRLHLRGHPTANAPSRSSER